MQVSFNLSRLPPEDGELVQTIETVIRKCTTIIQRLDQRIELLAKEEQGSTHKRNLRKQPPQKSPDQQATDMEKYTTKELAISRHALVEQVEECLEVQSRLMT